MLRYACISIVLTLLAILVAPYDAAITGAINMTGETGDLRRIMALSEIFAHGFGVLIAIAFVLVFAPEKARRVPRLLSCLVLTAFSIHLIKHLVVRRRPQSFPEVPELAAESWWLSNGGDNLVWNSEYLMQSFPSGHSATAFCLALALCWMFPRGKYLFFSLAIMAMLQRVMFLAHWPSDCLFGAAVATMTAGNVFKAPLSDVLFAWIEKPKKSEQADILKFETPKEAPARPERRAA